MPRSKKSEVKSILAFKSNYKEEASRAYHEKKTKPSYPLSAFCLYSQLRRTQIKAKNKKLTRKEVIEQIKEEWKTFMGKRRFKKQAREDYQFYKKLLKLWEADHPADAQPVSPPSQETQESGLKTPDEDEEDSDPSSARQPTDASAERGESLESPPGRPGSNKIIIYGEGTVHKLTRLPAVSKTLEIPPPPISADLDTAVYARFLFDKSQPLRERSMSASKPGLIYKNRTLPVPAAFAAALSKPCASQPLRGPHASLAAGNLGF